MKTVAHFPDIYQLAANPYWLILRTALEQERIRIHATRHQVFGRRWLWRNRHTVQVLHFHYVQRFYGYEGTQARLRWVLRFASNLLLARFLGYRTVYTVHNAAPTYSLQPAWVDHLGHWAAVNLASSVIVHCNAARQIVKERFGRRKHVYTVFHPHFIGQYANDIEQSRARVSLGIAVDSLVFSFIGGIRPNKGIENLIAAFRQLEGTNLRLIIAGEPWPPEEYVHTLVAAASRDQRILLHPRFIPDEELQTYLNAADAVVLPFARILTSSSAVLAMSFARPLIVPATGCLPELITAGEGILYDPTVSSGLLDALMQCQKLGPTALHELGQRAQSSIRRFTGQLMAETTLSAYRANTR
jgi:beta-1,4-mannosyltransferase